MASVTNCNLPNGLYSYTHICVPQVAETYAVADYSLLSARWSISSDLFSFVTARTQFLCHSGTLLMTAAISQRYRAKHEIVRNNARNNRARAVSRVAVRARCMFGV